MKLLPPYLSPGDAIYLLSTSRWIDKGTIDTAVDTFTQWGYRVILGSTLSLRHHQWAGNDRERINDFQTALNHSEAKAICFARGGYGSNRVIDYVDFTHFINSPKWLIGFSDITLIHNRVNQFYGIASIHGPMPITFSKNSELSLSTLHQNLCGELPNIVFPRSDKNKGGDFSGEVIGGNLSILYSLLGTDNGFNTNGKILMIEDLDEYLYHIDRMLIALLRANKLKGLKGLIIGGFTDLKDNDTPFGYDIYEMILQHCEAYDFPIVFDAPFGHLDHNMPLVLGANIKVENTYSQVTISYHQSKSNA